MNKLGGVPPRDATYQISNSGLPVSKMKNFEVGLLWSYIPICALSPTTGQGQF